MDILLIDPPYVTLKNMDVDRAYNMGLTSLAAYLRQGGVESAILTGDLLTGKRSALSRTFHPAILQNPKKYAAGQREYARIVSDPTHPVWQKITSIIRERNPMSIGICYFTPMKHVVAKVASLAKGVNKDIKVIAGSFHPTFCPDEVMQNPDIDFVVRGEGEIPLLALVLELKKDRPQFEKVPGITYRAKDGAIKSTAQPPPIANLDTLPIPARELVLDCDYSSYRLHAMITARGCPYTCSFCADRRLWGSQVRRRSFGNAINELKMLYETYHPSDIDIFDGTFTFDKKYVRSFCETLIGEGLNISWRCLARYDNLDEPLLKLMKRAGCCGLYFGLESGSDSLLKSVDKKFTVADIVKVNQLVRETGIPSETSVLLGLPEESKEDIEATLSLLQIIKTDKVDTNTFVPLPCTPIWDAMTAEEKKSVDWLKVGFKSYDTCFSKKMSREEFAAYRDEAYNIAGRVLRNTIIRLGAKAVISPVTKIFGRRPAAPPSLQGSDDS